MSDEARQEHSRDTVKRPYERPAVAWEEDFEPYVFSMCGKMPAQGGACVISRRS
jgi:hypothetical protein